MYVLHPDDSKFTKQNEYPFSFALQNETNSIYKTTNALLYRIYKTTRMLGNVRVNTQKYSGNLVNGIH